MASREKFLKQLEYYVVAVYENEYAFLRKFFPQAEYLTKVYLAASGFLIEVMYLDGSTGMHIVRPNEVLDWLEKQDDKI